MTRYIVRYRDPERMNHWVVAVLFILAAFSGLALFHPSMYFFNNLFGGGQWTRILHPFMGVLMFIGFIGLFFRFAGQNRINDADRQWRREAPRILRGELPHAPVGKYNYGQKLVFWLSAWSLLALVITGFVFWRPWFAPVFPIEVIRAAALIHAFAAFVLVLTIIVHIYAAIWVKGSMRAMTRGTVSEAWARRHHPAWHGEARD